MRSVVKYKLAWSGSADILSQEVTGLLANGWVLYGSPTTSVSPGAFRYCQALTKEDK